MPLHRESTIPQRIPQTTKFPQPIGAYWTLRTHFSRRDEALISSLGEWVNLVHSELEEPEWKNTVSRSKIISSHARFSCCETSLDISIQLANQFFKRNRMHILLIVLHSHILSSYFLQSRIPSWALPNSQNLFSSFWNMAVPSEIIYTLIDNVDTMMILVYYHCLWHLTLIERVIV